MCVGNICRKVIYYKSIKESISLIYLTFIWLSEKKQTWLIIFLTWIYFIVEHWTESSVTSSDYLQVWIYHSQISVKVFTLNLHQYFSLPQFVKIKKKYRGGFIILQASNFIKNIFIWHVVTKPKFLLTFIQTF